MAMLPNLEAECADYEEKIKKIGGINLFVGGVGADGHIAFNEPGSSLSSRTRVKTLSNDTLMANSRFFGGDINKVPKTVLTAGIATIMGADEVMIIASGLSKARSLRHVIEGCVSHRWTIGALQLHPKGIIVCDELACSELKLGTFKYYIEVESAYLDPEKLSLR